jgi:hypothetical protein
MLRELSQVEQIKGDYFRRCFRDENLFLIVWYEEDKTIHGFQFTFGSEKNERVLTWTKERGASCSRVDYGEQRRLFHPSAILLPCDDLSGAQVCAAFDASSAALPAPEVRFVREKLEALNSA